MPISIVVSNLVRFLVQMTMFLCLMAYYAYQGAEFKVNEYILLFPLLVILMALLGLGLGMIITSLTTKYRDLQFLIQFGVTLLMYTTTVIYPLSAAPEKYCQLINLNPMTPIIEAFRYGFLGQGAFSWVSLGYSTSFAIIFLLFGVVIFNKTERNFIDTI